MTSVTRRSVVVTGAAAVLSLPVASRAGAAVYADARLMARPGAHSLPFGGGTENLHLDRRDAVLFASENRDPAAVTPLILALHGAGQVGLDMIEPLRALARRRGFAVLAPTARGDSWRLRHGPVGLDAAFIDLSLQTAFDRLAVDPARIAVLGMSDGASYALSLGLANGDLFSDVIAMEPLRFRTPTTVGASRYFISIGRRDEVSGLVNVVQMADDLKAQGFDVELAEHGGGHVMDRNHLSRAIDRFLT
ncbi:hypothetical protein MU852_01530 [Brevundimonas albigilva]|uniref:Esterase n=1 Tax=Brevundimonas albigilva TaxID=1312364 RepID=A0ABY4SS81_9CAUL|nr:MULTISPECIES: hypothetical protein [Brevundimonas]UQV18634.1 hypothetical protein MU852_01530 [Brevundimonas albigilva]URI16591.1 hypothetical protein M8231_06350 [Brevundimonas albigilva]